MKFLTLEDVDVKGKTVFVRADLNCPVEGGKVELSPRMVEHAKTIYHLSQLGAKTVVLAHQGRKGREDFLPLSQHASLLSSQISKLEGNPFEVAFVKDVAGQKAQDAIKNLNPGGVLLLDNVRFLDSETEFAKTGKSALVQNLSPLCDIFVLDAFSVSHRAQASVVGFTNCPAVAGPVMEKELSALSKFENPARPTLLILGGAKPADSLKILQEWVSSKKADFALCGGALGNLMLLASGKSIGFPSESFLKKTGSLENLEPLKEFYSKNSQAILIPQDVIADEEGSAKTIPASSLPSNSPLLDIGPKTAALFGEKIGSAASIVLNGPMGVCERKPFASGTKAVLDAVANSKAYSLVGGGNTLDALERFSIPHSKFGYVSLSGKALMEFLSGEKLPGIEFLEKSAQKK